MSHLGYLSRHDPLHGLLAHAVLPQVGIDGAHAEFRVQRLPGSNSVYLYEDARSRLRLIGKFFGTVAGRSQRTAARYMDREWANLLFLRDLGFTHHPHYVSRPLARSAAIGCVLVEEFCEGVSLSKVLSNATRAGGHAELYRKLTALGYFLATLHNRTARATRVQLDPELRYGARLVEHLATHRLVDGGMAASLHALTDRWRSRGFMHEDAEVLVHGDVTPSNVLYGEHPWVIAIDLERMRVADRVFDVGRVAGEIKHHFLQDLGDRQAAEPFIGHFLWEYACHFPDRSRAFDSITRRVPFYMGLTLLRIARNTWVTESHRRALVEEAALTLR